MDFRPIDTDTLPWLRRVVMPLGKPVNRMLRWAWSHSGPSRSTWFDSRRWRAVWNVNRFFSAMPRVRHESRIVEFAPHIRMDLDLSRLTDALAFCFGPGEIEVAHACSLLCPRDGVVLDIGGNIGTTVLAFAARVPEGHVHAFEPSPDMLRCLRRNVELSCADNVTVHAVGLADQPSRGRLQVAIDGNPGSAYVGEHAEAAGGHMIELVRLDDHLGDLPRLDFVKVDVEGYELRALRGALALLQKHRPAVLFEVNESALQRAGTSGRELCTFLQQLGYGLHYLQRGRLRAYDPDTMLRRKLHNVIAVHPERACGRS